MRDMDDSSLASVTRSVRGPPRRAGTSSLSAKACGVDSPGQDGDESGAVDAVTRAAADDCEVPFDDVGDGTRVTASALWAQGRLRASSETMVTRRFRR